MLFKRPRVHRSDERIIAAGTQTTDDTGAFEFGNLPDGDYLVAVAAEPWYALHRPAGTAGAADPPADASAALDVAYPITYFDSTTDEASATPITVTAGSTESANVSLHAVPALHLFVPTPRRQDGGIARPELRQSIFGVQTSAESMGLFDAMHSGGVEFTGVAPGHYELSQGDPLRIVELDASSNQQIDSSLGMPTVEVTGALKSASGAALPLDVTVGLEPAGDETHRETLQAAVTRGGFRFSAVPQGKWTFSTQAVGRPLAVVATTINGRTYAGNAITVGDRALEVAVSVSLAEMRVEGFVRKDGKGVAGAMVVLVPKNLASIADLSRRDQSDSDGSFSLRNAAPGEYTIVAIENGWDLDWMRPEIIGRFLPHGTAVTVTDLAEKRMALASAVEAQTP
jgi:hypothetical protein